MGKLVFAAVLLAVWLAFRGRPEPYDITSHLENGRRTPLREGRLYSRSVGAGPDLVLLPGFAGNTQTWEFVTPDLARDYRVHWLDPLGHGLSDKPADARYDGAAHAERLAEWLDVHRLFAGCGGCKLGRRAGGGETGGRLSRAGAWPGAGGSVSGGRSLHSLVAEPEQADTGAVGGDGAAAVRAAVVRAPGPDAGAVRLLAGVGG